MQSALSTPFWPKGSPVVVTPTLLIEPKDYLKIIAYAQETNPAEINGYALVRKVRSNLFKVDTDTVFITDQLIEVGHVNTTPQGVMQANRLYMDADDGVELLQWHSHGPINAYHSSEDLRTADNFGRGSVNPWRIWVVVNASGEFVARLEQYQPIRIGVPMEVVMVPDDYDNVARIVRDDVARHVTDAPPPENYGKMIPPDMAEVIAREQVTGPTDGAPCAGTMVKVEAKQ